MYKEVVKGCGRCFHQASESREKGSLDQMKAETGKMEGSPCRVSHGTLGGAFMTIRPFARLYAISLPIPISAIKAARLSAEKSR